MAGATVIIHAAGWLEGGLTVSYEKLITDVEVLQMVAELCTTPKLDLALDALADVQPGGTAYQMGIRDFESIRDELARVGLTLEADHEMPANNRLLVFRRTQSPPSPADAT